MVRAEAAARLRPRPIAEHRFTLLDVFTDRPLAGNGLAVVHDADDLSDAVLHAFARETRLSETSFVQSPGPGAERADYRHRIFTIAGEIPFAGHPSLLATHRAITLYVAAVDPAAGRARARSFMASAEMGEDPATGSSVGPLCAHVATRTGAERLEIAQGLEMGRPSVLRAAVEGDRVRVGGDAVILAEEIVHLDG